MKSQIQSAQPPPSTPSLLASSQPPASDLLPSASNPPPASSQPSTFQSLPNLLNSGSGLAILGCLVLLVALTLLDKGGKARKGKLAKGRFGGARERRAAQVKALSQIREQQHNEVAIYLGRPNNPNLSSPFQLASSRFKNSLFLPDAQRGLSVVGGPGTGKTASVIDQTVLSVMDQGFPLILYDFKYPTQTSRLVGYALKQDYDVRVFAPGYPESEICNPLDFLKSEDDSLMARQFAEVLNRNFNQGGQSTEDKFFTTAGDQLTEAILMLAKGTDHADLMMCQALLSLTNLPKRLLAQQNKINPWIYASFGQLISVTSSEKTVASIIATANNHFTSFMKAAVLASFCGRTSLPLDLKGRQLLVLGMDREKRDVLAPLMATIVDLLISRNVTQKREDPLFLFLDEVPTLYLPRLANWLNENREDGLCTVLGFQNLVQLEKIYGKELARAVLGGCASKAVFNPQDFDSAKVFSDSFGDEEVHFKQKSRGRSGGKGSTNLADQERLKKLIPPEELLKMPKGNCVLVNPGFASRGESYLPIRQKVVFSSAYQQTLKASEDLWPSIRDKLIVRSPQVPISQRDIKRRYELAEKLFPAAAASSPKPQSNTMSDFMRFVT